MNDENKFPKALMLIDIPSNLRKYNIDEFSEERIESSLKPWELHTTPFFRMSINDKEAYLSESVFHFQNNHSLYAQFSSSLFGRRC